jgi:hypothetical protein
MPSCFVVMGYGVKTDFQQNKSFDLDKSYKYIIKPAVEAAGYTCERADEIQHAGVIDVPMYDRLLSADLVVADLSTANVNAFFELGVRYAMRPRTTIVVAEKGFKIPFDMGHVVIRHYEHLGPGIDYGEVERMKAELTAASLAIPRDGGTDSPVYTYIADLIAPARRVVEAAAAAAPGLNEERDRRTREAFKQSTSEAERIALSEPLAALMTAAIEARANEKFVIMRDVLTGIRAAQGEAVDPFVLQQLALATYKAGEPDRSTALVDAREVLRPLEPEASSDPETLGLWGAIHKRLWELEALEYAERRKALDAAIWAYEKGFYLQNDYYNGINFAFLLSTRAAQNSGDGAIADRVQARRIRERVLRICEDLLAAGIRGESAKKKLEEGYWIRATMVEALSGLGRPQEAAAAFEVAKAVPPEPWMIKSTEEQLAKLKDLLPDH